MLYRSFVSITAMLSLVFLGLSAERADADNYEPIDRLLIEEANVAVFGDDEPLDHFVTALFQIYSEIAGIDFEHDGERSTVGVFFGNDVLLEISGKKRLDVRKFELNADQENVLKVAEFDNDTCAMARFGVDGAILIVADRIKLGGDNRLKACITFSVSVIFGAYERIRELDTPSEIIAATVKHLQERNFKGTREE